MVEKVIKIIVNTKEASSEIKTLFNNMVKREKEAQLEAKKTEESIQNIGTSAEKSGKKQVITVNKTSKAVEFLDKQTGGLASSFLSIAKAAEKGGAAMKSAVISSGIGVFLLLLGEVMANWESISNWISGANEELERQKRLNDDINSQIDRQNTLRDQGLNLIKIQTDQDVLRAKIAGKSEEEIFKIKEKSAQDILALQQEQVKEAERILKESVGADEKTYQKAIESQELAYKNLSKARINLNKTQLEEELRIVNQGNKKKSNSDSKSEETRLAKIENIRIRYANSALDLEAKTEEEKLERERQRAQESLDLLKGSVEEKREAQIALNKLYDDKEEQLKRDKAAIDDEIAELRRVAENKRKLKALEDASKDDNLNPLEKLEKQKEALELENTILEEDYLIKQDLYEGNLLALAKLEEEHKDKQIAINKELAENYKDTEEEKNKEKTNSSEFAQKLNRIIASDEVKLADQTLSNLASLAKEGSDLAKGVAVAQATMDTFKGAVSAYAAGSSVGGPAGLVLGPVSAALAVAAGLGNIKKILSTKPIEKGAPSGAASGGGAAVPQAPAFNLVEGSGTNQIAESIGGQNKPLQAFVVSSEVTTAQGLDRNIVDNSGF